MAQKTNKSYTKRIKVSGNGKLQSRKKGQNHFNSKKTGQQRLNDRAMDSVNLSNAYRARFMPHS